MRFAANCTFLFTERALLERPAAARAAGFEFAELWWPFVSAVPSDVQADALVRSFQDAGVRLVGLNVFAGDLTGPDCGLASWPGRETEFRDGVAAAVAIGERLGTRVFNTLYGNRIDGIPPELQDELGAQNLAFAADAVGRIGAGIVIEPISGPKPYPLRTAADASRVVDELRASGHNNAGMLFDVYHLASNGEDLDAAIVKHAAQIAHVQLADVPGRGEPGSGVLPLVDLVAAIERTGYDGWFGLEYVPSVHDTLGSLAWLDRLGLSRVGKGRGDL